MGAFAEFAHAVDWQGLSNMILRVAAILVCLVFHEVSHGLAAWKLGDPTARMEHRLSLNPLHHLDVFGTLMMLVAGFGWARPVPVDPRYFRNPRRGMAITALAGPAANFVMAYLSLLLYNALAAYTAVRGSGPVMDGLTDFLSILVLMNIGLGIFNLVPFPPLDGSKVLAMFLPDRLYMRWMALERYGMLVLMLLLWSNVLDRFLYAARGWVLDIMYAGTEFAWYGVLALLGY